jgi:hypothetical protein
MSAIEFTKVNTDQIDRAISFVAAAGVNHLLPLLRGVRAHRIALLQVLRGGAAPAHELKAAGRRPFVLLVGDDDYRPAGPSGWPDADGWIRWARAALVNAAGVWPEHYQRAVDLAERYGRVFLVETSSTAAPAWLEALNCAPRKIDITLILPPPSDTHPVMPAAVQVIQ